MIYWWSCKTEWKLYVAMHSWLRPFANIRWTVNKDPANIGERT